MWSYLLFVFAANLVIISADMERVNGLEDLNEHLSAAESKLVVLQIAPDWVLEKCDPCKALDADVEKLSRELTDVVFLKTDTNQNILLKYHPSTNSMVQIILIKNFAMVDELNGMNAQGLVQLIKKHK